LTPKNKWVQSTWSDSICKKNLLIYEHFAEIAKFKNGNITQAAAADFAFLLAFIGLVEYEETNGVPGLQIVGWNAPSGLSDTLLSVYYNNSNTGDVLWDITLTSVDTEFPTGPSAKVYTLTFATSDGVFNYTVTYAGRDLFTGGANIDANSFKIGFNIMYYNYKGASSNPNSQISLLLVAAAEKSAAKSVSNGSPTTISNFKVASGGYEGYINFEDTAGSWDINGVYASTGITFGYLSSYGLGLVEALSDWTVAAFFLSYDAIRPSVISYDPEVGANLPASAGSFTSPVGLALYALVVLIFAAL